MSSEKLKYILVGIFVIVFLLVLIVGGIYFWQTKPEKSPPPAETPKKLNTQEIVGTIKNLGNEEEFTLEKDGLVVFQNRVSEKPKIKYRLALGYSMTTATWRDLKEGDRATLTITYDEAGQIESRILRIFREIKNE